MRATDHTPPVLFQHLDDWFDRLYTWRYNPLYQSGVLAVFLLLIMIGTGIYLVFFYTVATPYASVQLLQQQHWGGRWIRSVHRYAADAAVVAVAYHLLRMLVQRRCWGPRLLAWVSGVILLGTLFFSGLTGFLLVGDLHSQVLSMATARLLDLLPIFSEPLARAFSGPDALPRSFYFMTLFIHVSMPLGFVFLLWLHTSKLARPTILPPRALMWGTGLLLFLLALTAAVPLAPIADLHTMVTRFPFDPFYTFWLPLTAHWSAAQMLCLFLAGNLLLLAIPAFLRPPVAQRPLPSFVQEKSCTGCSSCYQDCPYEAIAMVPRSLGYGSPLVANVDPARCVSCGICAAACDPMGVGPAERTGRHQLKSIEQHMTQQPIVPDTILVVSCEQSIVWPAAYRNNPQLLFTAVHCAGELHTVVLEYALKHGISGIFLLTCPPRNCVNCEGPKWLLARVYGDHDSALHPRIDREQIHVAHCGARDITRACAELDAFAERLRKKFCADLSDLPDKICVTTESVS